EHRARRAGRALVQHPKALTHVGRELVELAAQRRAGVLQQVQPAVHAAEPFVQRLDLPAQHGQFLTRVDRPRADAYLELIETAIQRPETLVHRNEALGDPRVQRVQPLLDFVDPLLAVAHPLLGTVQPLLDRPDPLPEAAQPLLHPGEPLVYTTHHPFDEPLESLLALGYGFEPLVDGFEPP